MKEDLLLKTESSRRDFIFSKEVWLIDKEDIETRIGQKVRERRRRSLSIEEATREGLKILGLLVTRIQALPILILCFLNTHKCLNPICLILKCLILCTFHSRCREASDKEARFLSTSTLTMSQYRTVKTMKCLIPCRTWDGHPCQQQRLATKSILSIITLTERRTLSSTRRSTCSLKKSLEKTFRDETFLVPCNIDLRRLWEMASWLATSLWEPQSNLLLLININVLNPKNSWCSSKV